MLRPNPESAKGAALKVLLPLVFLCSAVFALTDGENYHGVAVAPNGLDAWVVTIETTNIYHTEDFGANWVHQPVMTIRDFFDVCFINDSEGWTCARLGAIYHTTNGGDTWMQQNLGGPKFASRIQFLNTEVGWAASGEAILLYTTSGGEAWEMTMFPNPPYPTDTVDFHGLCYVSQDTGWLVAGRFPEGDTFARGQGYIVRTTDRGTNWELQRKDTVNDFYDVRFLDGENGFVAGGDDQSMAAVILRTSNGGLDWSPVTLPARARFLRAIDFVGDRHGWACGRHGTVVHTSDGGTTWELQPVAVDTTLFDIDFADTLRGMIAGNSVVLATTDGGSTWTRVFGGVEEDREVKRTNASRLSVSSNPARARVEIQLKDVAQWCEVVILDALGRRVASPFRGRPASGLLVDWDGRDCHGRQVGAGVYLVQLRAGGQSESARFVYLGAE